MGFLVRLSRLRKVGGEGVVRVVRWLLALILLQLWVLARLLVAFAVRRSLALDHRVWPEHRANC